MTSSCAAGPLAGPALEHEPAIAATPLASDATEWLASAPIGGLALGLVVSLGLAGGFSTLSASLLRAVPGSLGGSPDPLTQRELGDQLERTETYAASASLAASVFRALAAASFFVVALRTIGLWATPEATLLGEAWFALTLACFVTAIACGPLLHLVTQSIPIALAQAHGPRVLRLGLPPFALVQRPLGWGVFFLAALRRVVLRAFRTPDANHGTRKLVEGFRAMVEGAEYDGELGDETRELIANVIEFGAADAAEVMTPRTEIEAVDRSATLADAIRVFAETGFSRIPVYDDTVDTIIGTLTALEAAKAVAEERVDDTAIVEVMRPPLLVPETQPVPELLSAFRAERQKMAIVVDEYGGTAGLVTLADVMAEIVGHVQDEFEAEDTPYQRLDPERVEADAGLHVSEVNEELGLTIPEEEDFETLAGFVLAEFGRFPVPGESFEHEGVRFRITEASDRRVLRVVIKRAGGIELAREAKERESPDGRAPFPREGRGTTIALRPGSGRVVRAPAERESGADERRRA